MCRAAVSGLHVVRLEWRSRPRPQDFGLTSHSSLQMFLSDGSSSTLEFLAHRGFKETRLVAPDDSALYNGCVVLEFPEPISVQEVRRICCAKGAVPYSTMGFNCHHWALAVWNSVVPSSLQQCSYPDKWKSNLASSLGLSKMLDPMHGEDSGASGGLLGCGGSCLGGVISWWLGAIA